MTGIDRDNRLEAADSLGIAPQLIEDSAAITPAFDHRRPQHQGPIITAQSGSPLAKLVQGIGAVTRDLGESRIHPQGMIEGDNRRLELPLRLQ